VREKHYSDWKNKLKSTDYKLDEQGHYTEEEAFMWSKKRIMDNNHADNK
jgi:hypothetical protein